MSSQPAACTTACTDNAEIANEPADADLAAIISNLTPEQRRRLASMLRKKQEGGES